MIGDNFQLFHCQHILRKQRIDSPDSNQLWMKAKDEVASSCRASKPDVIFHPNRHSDVDIRERSNIRPRECHGSTRKRNLVLA